MPWSGNQFLMDFLILFQGTISQASLYNKYVFINYPCDETQIEYYFLPLLF